MTKSDIHFVTLTCTDLALDLALIHPVDKEQMHCVLTVLVHNEVSCRLAIYHTMTQGDLNFFALTCTDLGPDLMLCHAVIHPVGMYSNLSNKRPGRLLILRFLSRGSISAWGSFIYFSGV